MEEAFQRFSTTGGDVKQLLIRCLPTLYLEYIVYMNGSIIILFLVFVLIAVRKIGGIKLSIWQIMSFGAVAVLSTGLIPLATAFKSINLDVMLFLFAMFVIGQALEESGYLSNISFTLFKSTKNADHLILSLLFIMGIASTFLMNDTVAIIGTPIVVLLSKRHRISSKLLLLTLAFAVTIGSVMSPIGNPQNLLIAINGNISNPFMSFLKYLFLPTIINLLFVYFILKLFYIDQFYYRKLVHAQESIKDYNLANLSKLSFILIVLLIFTKIITIFLRLPVDFKLTYIALIAAFPILAFSPKRFHILKKIDWHTLLFFATMFILMESVWESGFFQKLISDLNLNITSTFMILIVSVVLSQLISNVPLVALYLPMLIHAGASTKEMVDLAVGSTIAGNLFIIGAASNIIIIQNAEMRSGETLTFLEFARVGVPLTFVNIIVYWIFLKVL